MVLPAAGENVPGNGRTPDVAQGCDVLVIAASG
jgi:hypothetical protein